MNIGRKLLAATGAAIAVAGFVLSPAMSIAQRSYTTPSKIKVLITAQGGLGSFTPAAADPRLAAALAQSGFANAGFRFTPSSDSGKNRQVTVAVRARTFGTPQTVAAIGRAEAPVIASLGILPSAYNLGASVGWKRFALSADMTRINTGLLPGSRESLSASASYNAKKWSGQVQLGADRNLSQQLLLSDSNRAYSVDVGGSYKLTRNLNVTAGVRYRLEERDRLQPIADARRDSQAVYVGTAFKF